MSAKNVVALISEGSFQWGFEIKKLMRAFKECDWKMELPPYNTGQWNPK